MTAQVPYTSVKDLITILERSREVASINNALVRDAEEALVGAVVRLQTGVHSGRRGVVICVRLDDGVVQVLAQRLAQRCDARLLDLRGSDRFVDLSTVSFCHEARRCVCEYTSARCPIHPTTRTNDTTP